MTENIKSETELSGKTNYKEFLVDLIIYISVMFLVREIYIPKVGFIANGLFWSLTTLIVASWRMKVRGVSWKDLGLKRPDNLGKTLGISAIIFVSVMLSIILFEIIQDNLPFSIASDTSSENAVSKFGDLKGNWPRFFCYYFLHLG